MRLKEDVILNSVTGNKPDKRRQRRSMPQDHTPITPREGHDYKAISKSEWVYSPNEDNDRYYYFRRLTQEEKEKKIQAHEDGRYK
jgi:hypothetical protein